MTLDTPAEHGPAESTRASGRASVGLDLHVPLGGGRTVRDIEAGLRALVQEGRLPVGTRLPASRALAADLGVARNTVAELYARLAAEGWLQTRVGAGTWVAAAPRSEQEAPVGRTTEALFELRGGLVDAGDFPHASWSGHVRRAVAGMPSTAFGYPDPAGVPALRESLAAYLARTRGVVTSPNNVLVGSGFGDLLALVCRMLRARGRRRIAVEEYGHERHRRIVAAAGLAVVPLRVDEEGADIGQLLELDVGAVLLTPAHQFPTGVPLSARRRRAAVEWARSTGGLVLEDDYDGEFRYDQRSIGALQGLAPESVLYFGTASKALAPALGFAWAVAPPDLREEILAHRELSPGIPAGVHQYAMASFMDSFEYDRAVRRRRSTFRTRRNLLAQLLAERAPHARIDGVAAGLQCLVRLPDALSEERVVTLAAAREIAIDGLASYRVHLNEHPTDAGPAGVVVGYGAATPARAEEALTTLVETIAAVARERDGAVRDAGLPHARGAGMSMPAACRPS